MDLLKALYNVPNLQGSITLWKPKGGTVFVTLDDLHNFERQEDWYFHIPTHTPELIAEGKRGSKRSANQFTALWVDFDMSWKDPKYTTDAEFKLFMEHLHSQGIAPSAVVNSGGGYHLYWFLDQAYPCRETPSACKSWNKFILKTLNTVINREIKVDQLGDMARVLRLPGTINKGKLVRTVGLNENVRFSLQTLLSFTDYHTITEQGDGKAATTNRLLQAMGVTGVKIPSYTRNLIDKCGQVRNFFTTGGDVSEPLWYSLAGLLPFTEDGTDYFINLSVNADPIKDSDRSASGALAKIEQWKSASDGPATCQRFHDHEPSICQACPHFNNPKIKTPLQVGRDEISQPIEPAQVIESPSKNFTIKAEVDHDSFTPPEPFQIDHLGRITMTVKNAMDIPEAKVITRNKLIPRKTIWAEAEKKGYIYFDIHTEHNGIRECAIMMGDLSGANSPAIRMLMEKNLLVAHGQAALLSAYLSACNEYMQGLSKVNNSYARMGWRSADIDDSEVDNDDRFVLGNLTCYRTGEVKIEQVDPTLESTAKTLKMSGDVEKWKQAISYFANKGMEKHLLVLMGGFAVPLLRAGQTKGLTVNLVSRESGTLKSFALRALTSIYGEPDEAKISKDDTYNAQLSKISRYCDIPVTFDEITNIQTEELGPLLYLMTGGKRGDRMTQANDIRENPLSWRTVLFCSSNSSLDDKLNSWSAPERMRLLELPVSASELKHLSSADNRAIMNTLNSNYGQAGVLWLQYLASNRDEVFAEVNLMINEMMKLTGTDDDSKRYWVSFLACTLVAARHTRKIGLHSFDLTSLANTARNIVDSSSSKVDSDELPLPMYVHTFIKESLDTTQSLKYEGVQSNEILSRNKAQVLREARGDVNVLIEIRQAIGMGTQRKAYLARAALKKFLSLHRISFQDMLEALKQVNVLISDKERPRVKIDNGTTNVQMYAISIDMDKLNSICELEGATVSHQDTAGV